MDGVRLFFCSTTLTRKTLNEHLDMIFFCVQASCNLFIFKSQLQKFNFYNTLDKKIKFK